MPTVIEIKKIYFFLKKKNVELLVSDQTCKELRSCCFILIIRKKLKKLKSQQLFLALLEKWGHAQTSAPKIRETGKTKESELTRANTHEQKLLVFRTTVEKLEL